MVPIGASAGMSPGMQRTDERSELSRYDSCHPSITFRIQDRNRRNESGTNRRTTPCTYWMHSYKKDEGWEFLDGGSTPTEPNEDGPAIMFVATLTVGKDSRTCKTLNR
jgi:hypothetical protein